MKNVVLCIAVLLNLAPGQGQEQVNQSSLVLQDFQKRIDDYLKVRKAALTDGRRQKPTDSPEALSHRERKIAHEIHEARESARQGDVFSAAISAEFRRLIAMAMKGNRAAAIEESMAHSEPVRLRGQLRVNQVYPSKVPLQSMPPTLLANLPRLPAELDYRVVDHVLVLRDVDANLIIDFIPSALP